MKERWGDVFEPTANADLDDIWSEYVERRRAEVVVVELEGAIVGTGTLVPIDVQTGELVRIAVNRQQRRKGIGALVVKELARRARENGMKTLCVTTDPPWTDAIALYRACGFTVVQTTSAAVALTMDLTLACQQ